jgi:cytochrome P450
MGVSRDPLGFLEHVAGRYGDISSARFGLRTVVFVNHPDLVAEAFVNRHADCIKDWTTRELKPLLGEGLLTSDGEDWRKHRKLAAPALQPKRIESYAQAMVEAAARRAALFRDDEKRDVHADMMQVTLEIVGRTLLGFDASVHGERVSRALEDVFAYYDARLFSAWGVVMTVFPRFGRARLDRARASLEGVVMHMIERARRDQRDDYLLAQLLRAQGDDGERMSDRQACDEALTLLLAGHETTALTLSYAIYLLARAPECEAELRRELAALGERAITTADLPQLPYLDAVVRETLRLYPPAWVFAREVVTGFELAGYAISPGMEVMCSPYTLQRDPRFFERPLQFEPARWLDPGRTPPRYAYVPFGAGPRVCIGLHFAKLETTLALATLLQHVRLRLVPGYRLALKPVITMRPQHGLPVIVERVRPGGSSAQRRAEAGVQ